MIYLLFRFLPIVLFVTFLLWLKFRKERPLQQPDPALRRWFWAMVIAIAISIGSLILWALEQAKSVEAEHYEHESTNP